MKTEIRMALLCLATVAVPAFAQDSSPRCGATNYDASQSLYTIVNPAAQTVNQQCFLTVYPTGAMPSDAYRTPASYIAEGHYVIELTGGGGGGGGGASRDQGGGGGGAGAAPSRTVRYLSPGLYKLTLGTGGDGGVANGGWTWPGNPTSITHAYSGELIAGFAGADRWIQRAASAHEGQGGIARAGESSGGSGGDSGKQSEEKAQAGGYSPTYGYAGRPGQSGAESGRSVRTDAGRVVQANAGGGGGASVGSGGAGESSGSNATVGTGDLGGGGGGGRGGIRTSDTGGTGGHGFVRLTMSSTAR